MNSNYADESRHLRAHSPSANSSLVFNENTKGWFIAAAVSLSIAINILLGVLLWDAYRLMGDRITVSLKAKEQTEDLKRYDLDFFKQNDWADMKTRILTNERLVNMMGADKCLRR